jgi:hypothetical protein
MNVPEDPDSETTVEEGQPSPSYTPPDWISTDQLDTQLWNAIMEDTRGNATDEPENWKEEFDVCLDEEDLDSSEAEQRQSSFNLLIDMRPLLGELLGGPTIVKGTRHRGRGPENRKR